MINLTPDITDVAVPHHGVLRLTFADGTTGDVPVLERMRGPVFDEARTREGFARVSVDPETGTVVWPGGIDLAPDTLYERVRTAPGRIRKSLPEPRRQVRRRTCASRPSRRRPGTAPARRGCSAP